MADKKISQLTGATTPLAGSEVLPVVQSSSTVKVSVTNLTAGRAVAATSFTTDGSTSAAVQLSGTQLAATGSSSTIDVDILPKGTDGVTSIGGVYDLVRIDSGGSNAYPSVIAATTTTNTTRITTKPALTLLNGDTAFTAGRMARMSFAAISYNLNLPIHAADITAVFTSGSSGNGVSTQLVFSTTNNAVTQTPVERLKIDENGNTTVSTGNLVVGTAGKGIDFSASTHAAGMTSELLADYEEGTFTPTLEGNSSSSGNVYSTQVGTYVKVGSIVVCTIALTVSTWGTNTGIATFIKGLPFTTNSSGYPFTIVGWSNLNANYVIIQAYADPSDTKLVLTGATAASASSIGFVPPTDIKNSTTLYLVFTYRSA